MSDILRRGSKGPAVSQLQRELKRQIVSTLGVDGDFGPDTEAAVRTFQESIGFRGKDVDGVVGPNTTLALCQTFDMRIWAKFRKHPTAAITPFSLAPVKPGVPAKLPTRPIPPVPPKPAAKPDPLPKTVTANLQFGIQQADRDSRGYQLLLGATYRRPDYRSRIFMKGTHLEVMPSLTFGVPFPYGALVTGQFSITVQPLTDWLVIKNRWHLLTPSIAVNGQIPLNPGQSDKADPGTHSRLGGNVGLELFHYDLIPDKLAVGISGQESFYYDYTNHKVFYDPSAMAFLQWNFKSW